MSAFEKPFSLTDVYSAEEAFVTGTFGGLTPVMEVDGRTIGMEKLEITVQLQNLYKEAIHRSIKMTLRINCWSGPRNISTAYSFRERSDTTVVDDLFMHII